mgnify:CR=1 FL=1
MTLTFRTSIRSMKMTAVLISTAVMVVFSTGFGAPTFAGQAQSDVLAAELRIVRADLIRLGNGDALAQRHVQGLKMRIAGGLGVLPWLLRQSGDDAGAERLRGWNIQTLDGRAERVRLVRQLDTIIMRHRLDLSRYGVDRVTIAQKREARAIHETYCAGCHDDAGQGDADMLLPARDLYAMSRESASEDFLARIINGVEGDETLLFSNPLTAQQIAALWALYRE